MKKAGIIGLGLIGGSIAKALRKYCGVTEIVALNRSAAPLTKALKEGVITAATHTVDENFKNCGVIFVCTPVDKIAPAVMSLRPYIDNSCIITDVGSTKNDIYESLSALTDISYIGGHPMAGSEKTGYAASKDILFENAYYLLTPAPHVSKERVEGFIALLKLMGAMPVVIPPALHDRAVAGISHMPHVIASALVNAIKDSDDDKKTMYTLAAGGFRDITRIASGSPEMWSSIIFENRCEILEAIGNFTDSLSDLKRHIIACDKQAVYDFLSSAKIYRDSFAQKNAGGYLKEFRISVDIPDKPGIIASISALLSANGINIKNIGIVNSREYENGVLNIVFETEADSLKSTELLREMNYTVYGGF